MKSCSPDESKASPGKRKSGGVWKRRWDGGIKKTSKRKLMKPSIWSNTPSDIQLQLLKFLPVASLARFRCVSRYWHTAIATTTPSSSTLGFISISLTDTLRIRNGSSWKIFGLADILQLLDLRVKFVHTSAGLVLATEDSCVEGCRLAIYNPLVPSSARFVGALPEVRDWPRSKVAFTGIQALPTTVTSQGKISIAVVCVTSGQRVLLHVFDSRSWSWVVISAPVPKLGHYDYGGEEGLYHERTCHNSFLLQDEVLYFLTVSNNSSGTRSLKCVSIWDPEHTCKTLATWRDLPLGLHQNPFTMLRHHNHPSLIQCQGKLVLVTMIPTPPCGAIGFVYLDEEAGRWRKLLRFPMESFPERVWKKNAGEQQLVGAVWAAGSPESSKVALYFMHSSWGCIFDVAHSTWKPAFPCKHDTFQAFHPSFLTF